MSRAIIRSLLNDHVDSIVGLPPIQYENTPNIGQTGKPFTRVTNIPANTLQVSAGINGKDRALGLLQIDLFFPTDLGTINSELMADAVIAAFPRGLTLTHEDTNTVVHFKSPSVRVGYTFEPFYCLPITVEWSSVLQSQ